MLLSLELFSCPVWQYDMKLLPVKRLEKQTVSIAALDFTKFPSKMSKFRFSFPSSTPFPLPRPVHVDSCASGAQLASRIDYNFLLHFTHFKIYS